MATYRNIIGRKDEQIILADALQSNKAELLVVYGRRRIGKTYLIREFYQKHMQFELTGLHKGGLKDQLHNFSKELNKRTKGKKSIDEPNGWLEAFSQLENHIDKIPGKKKKVIFIDEFPWIATPRSKFLMSFEGFWNSYASKRKDIIVVICGSAASYMVKKIIKNKGGLHNRISNRIRLLPFTLEETRLFLENKGIKYTHYDILQIYMVMGGVPHYLDNIKRGKSVIQNIDSLCFAKDGFLRTEYEELYSSLFDNSEKHIAIVEALAKVRKGITRSELMKKSNIPSGGDLSQKLEELKESGFISEYNYKDNKKQNTQYRLSDEYTLFYLKYIKANKTQGKGAWHKISLGQSFKSWSGFCFETICLKHSNQIRNALGLEMIYCTFSSWYNDRAQIDMVIERDDRIINLCEIKFANKPFVINKTYHQNLINKRSEFLMETKSRKNVNIAMITTYGVKQNKYSLELVENELVMEDLFG